MRQSKPSKWRGFLRRFLHLTYAYMLLYTTFKITVTYPIIRLYIYSLEFIFLAVHSKNIGSNFSHRDHFAATERKKMLAKLKFQYKRKVAAPSLRTSHLPAFFRVGRVPLSLLWYVYPGFPVGGGGAPTSDAGTFW